MRKFTLKNSMNVLTKLATASSLMLLSGCFITVTQFTGGKVTSNLGADCTDNCNFQLNEGESFSQTFSATPFSRNEFAGWYDSLGSNFSICPHPTQLVCEINLSPLHELFEGLELNIEARFRAVSGFNVNTISFLESGTINRVIVKVNDFTWSEQYTPLNVIYNYNLIEAANSSFALQDLARDVTYFFDLNTGTILERDGANPIAPFSTIAGVSAKPNGHLASRVLYGKPSGFLVGEYIQTDKLVWIDRRKGRKKAKYTYAETNRDGSNVFLFDESRDVEIRLDVIGGVVYSTSGEEATEQAAIIHKVMLPFSGSSVSSVTVTEGLTDVTAHFIEKGENIWAEVIDGEESTAILYELVTRSLDNITLFQRAEERTVVINFDTGVVTTTQGGFAPPIQIYTVVEAN